MTHPDPGRGGDADEAAVAGLLKAAGRRDDPPADFARELKATLRAEWEATLQDERRQHEHDARQKARERWRLAGAAAAVATVAAMGLGLWFSRAPDVVVAQVIHQVGNVQLPVNRTQGEVVAVKTGESLSTAADGRVALAFPSGVSVRLDSNSSLTFDAAERVTLNQGAVYVDGGIGANRPLTIATPFGDVRHLGTQYEARLSPDGLQLSVREGLVELHRSEGTLQGVAGERLQVAASGIVERTRLASDAVEWAWASSIAPVFDIEQRPLTEFLVWAGRETGRSIVFASPASQLAAAEVVLKGSVAGLTPDQAIDAVLATTTLSADRSPGQILIRD